MIIRADDLVPEDITRLLRAAPTRTQTKGLPLSGRAGAPIAKFGFWALSLTAQETDEWDVSEAIRLLISRFSAQPGVWKSIPEGGNVLLNIGLHLEGANKGFSLPADVSQFVADRNIEIEFDIYDRTMA